MAMLTASREAMVEGSLDRGKPCAIASQSKYLQLHPYRRHSWTPTHFS
jgi:hypothetical protein